MDGYLCRFTRSTIGLKAIMAVTGIVMFGYLVGHVTGNWLIFAGREKINAYSSFLHHAHMLLWGTRIVLLASVVLHIWATVRFLALRGAAPRGQAPPLAAPRPLRPPSRWRGHLSGAGAGRGRARMGWCLRSP